MQQQLTVLTYLIDPIDFTTNLTVIDLTSKQSVTS